MAKETDWRGRATMNEADLEYLRNINTRPGPNAGRSIDPSKPGPDDPLPRQHQDPSKWVSREDMERAQSDAEPKDVREKLRYLIIDHIGGCDLRLVQRAHDITDALADSILSAFPALAQSDAEPQETRNKQLPGPDSILHELGDCPTQSDAEPDEDRPIGFRTNDVPNPYAEGPSIDEDAVNAAFDKWAKPRSYRTGDRLSFYAGVEFGLCHAPERLNADVRALRQQIEHYHGKWGKRDA